MGNDGMISTDFFHCSLILHFEYYHTVHELSTFLQLILLHMLFHWNELYTLKENGNG